MSHRPCAVTLLLSLGLLHCGVDEPSHVVTNPSSSMETTCTLKVEDTLSFLECGEDIIPLSSQDGINGRDGIDGAQGAPGRDGTDGQDGMRGMDGASVRIRTVVLPQGDVACPEGGRRIEVFEGDDEEPSATLTECRVRCSQGEVYDPSFDQCIKMVELHFEGVASKVGGTLPEGFAPSRPIMTSTLGILDPGVTLCSGVLRYPFMQQPALRTGTRADYSFGQYVGAGLELTVGDLTYTRSLTALEPEQSTMSRQLIENAMMDETRLVVEVTQERLKGTPEGVDAVLYLNAGDVLFTPQAHARALNSPDEPSAWRALGDEVHEELTLFTLTRMTEQSAWVTCRITHVD